MRCKATARSGDPCRRAAMKGGTVCASHGGKSPQAKAAAARRLAEQEAAKAVRLFSAPVDVDPARALVDLVQWTAGEVAYWRTQVKQLADEDPKALTWGVTRIKDGGTDGGTTLEATPNIAYRMLTDAQDRLAKYAAAALRAGVEERRVKLAEDQGALVAQAIRSILDQLDLTPAQVSRVPEVVPAQLRLLTAA
ncbi:hypothetical protein NLU66_16585 [Brachybacterium sp. NBEC-018]|uniref:HGGxSTG domain-containing protein n=1 Tax=Brachybacterium sp. NBEC-018 TaxID=2996004 RepID=UPI002175244E|nr:HGGxSTG domain-containing protein [Brachybacterium sp. NBEC-018]UVY83805.1 hypothetical protein NLU66_16585 [Brachybacterium sp. NBEC-018]